MNTAVKTLIAVLSTWTVCVIVWLVVENRASISREKSFLLQISNLNDRLEKMEKLKEDITTENSNIEEEKQDLKKYIEEEKGILEQQRENLKHQLDNGRNNLQQMVDRIQQIKLLDKLEEKLQEIRPNSNSQTEPQSK